MRTTVREFGLVSGLRAVGAGLLSVWGADRDVKGCVGVAQGRGEGIRRPQVSARDERKDLHLGRAIARLGRCVCQRGDRVVTAWPRPLHSRSRGLHPYPKIRSGRQRKAQVRMAHHSPGAGGPSRRTPRAPSLLRDVGSSSTSTCDRPQHPQVPAVARAPPGALLLIDDLVSF